MCDILTGDCEEMKSDEWRVEEQTGGGGRQPISRGGGGHSSTEWIPTAKWLRKREFLNGKMYGRSALFREKNFFKIRT